MQKSLRFQWPWHGRQAQRGISGPMFAVLLLPMLLFVGLVVDGGRVLVAQRRAQGAVDAAALAAAMAIDETAFKESNQVKLNSDLAAALADHYTHFNSGSSSGITSLHVDCKVGGADNTHVDCIGTLTVSTIFMRLGGIPSVSLRLTAGSDIKYGITQAGQ